MKLKKNAFTDNSETITLPEFVSVGEQAGAFATMADLSTTQGDRIISAAPTSTGNVSKVYQHWADGDAAKGSAASWNNNILSDSKSDYFEGEVIPHAFIFKASNSVPLVNGQTYSFNITYNYYQANTNAGGFAYITTYDTSRDPGVFVSGSPSQDASFTNGGGIQGVFDTINANITNVSGVTYTGSGTKDGHVTVTFTYTGQTTTSGFAEIYYGLMIASPGQIPDQGKGVTDGANAWTGGSLQTTVDIGGSGATSIQLAPSAIIVGEISGMKFNDINGDGTRDANGIDNVLGNADDEVGLAGWTIFLDKDNDGSLDAGEVSTTTGAGGTYTFSVTPDADKSDADNDPYIVREIEQAGWTRTSTNPAPILITSIDPTEAGVNFGNQMQVKALHIEKDASVADGIADEVGDVINYTLAVTNAGNAAIAGVVVDDPFTTDEAPVLSGGFNVGDLDQDGLLDVSESWSYTASHTVTQAELDSGANIANMATATGTDATPDDDDASVPVDQNKALHIEKDASVVDGTADEVGDVINYTLAVTNAGNAAIAGVVVDDPFTTDEAPVLSGGFNVGDLDQDGLLDVSESWSYTASHTVTQAELDSGANIANMATATGTDATPDDDDASVPVDQNKALHIEKDASVADGIADEVGDVINYTLAVTNAGNAAIAGVVVDDPFTTDEAPVLSGGFNVGDLDQDGLLDVSESWSYTASHTVTQAELDSGANIANMATATGTDATPDDDDASVPVDQNKALHIEKDASVADGIADEVGDVINYTLAVTNAGNAAIAGVVVDDPFTTDEAPVLSGGFNVGDLDQDGLLDVSESWSYTASHTVTQAELDSGANIANMATATGTDATPDDDDASVPVDQNKALHIEKDASVADGIADEVGDVINYTLAVTNAGNAAIAGVVVDDPFTTDEAPVLSGGFNVGDLDQDGLLDVSESWSYTASHTVTQAELDSGANIANMATATGTDATPDDDDASVPVDQNKALHIEKDASVADGIADEVGDVINYTLAVTNAGNAAIAGVVVDDPFTTDEAPVLSGGFNVGDLDQDGLLDVSESWSYTASHTVTQAELDSGANIANMATATGTDATPDDDDASVPVDQNPALNIVKTASPGQVADAAGELITYGITVENTGNQTLTGIVVTDPSADTGSIQFVSGDTDNDNQLDVDETWTFSAARTVTQAEIDNNGGGDGDLDNTAYADSDQTGQDSDDESVPIYQNPSLNIVKTADPEGQVARFEDEQITYSIAVENTGNQTLTGITLTDTLADSGSIALVSGDTDSDGKLDVDETWVYSAVHTVTQAELNAGGNYDTNSDGKFDALRNVATADSNETGPDTDDAIVPVLPLVTFTGSPYYNFPNSLEQIQVKGAEGQGSFFINSKTFMMWDFYTQDKSLAAINLDPATYGSGYAGLTVSIALIWVGSGADANNAVYRVYVANETNAPIQFSNNTDAVHYQIIGDSKEKGILDLINGDPLNGNFNNFSNIENAIDSANNNGFLVAPLSLNSSATTTTRVWSSTDVTGVLDDEAPSFDYMTGSGNDLIYLRNNPLGTTETAHGGDGNDLLLGRDGADVLYGDAGNDWLFGSLGSDTLYGGTGSDRLFGSYGHDELTGGAGADVFLLRAGDFDTIHDFNSAEGDQILIWWESRYDTGILSGGTNYDELDILTNGPVPIPAGTFYDAANGLLYLNGTAIAEFVDIVPAGLVISNTDATEEVFIT